MALNLTPRREDHVRAARLLLAHRSGDTDVFELVLGEANEAAGGVAGLIFALALFCSELVDMRGGGSEDLFKALQSLLDEEPT